jgi:trehalose 6-phosphate phosphatase
LPGRADARARLPEPLRPVAGDPTRSALFLDFDGTMAGIVRDPRDARALPGVPELLATLAARFGLVAVISGRPTAFLAEALQSPPGVTLAGLYGLERALQGPEAATWAGVVNAVVAEATASAPPGIYVEPKGLTVTLHWRRTPDQKDWVLAFAARQHAERGLMVVQGRHERELRPPLDVDKGTVVRSLVDEHDARGEPLRAAAAFGDDVGDLPAFAALDSLREPAGPLRTVVRVAAVDTESPASVAAAADLTVSGATGAVSLLHDLAEAAGSPTP